MNWAVPISTRPRLLPSRRIAAVPSWTISITSSRHSASQPVSAYTCWAGPSVVMSGVRKWFSSCSTIRSTHSPPDQTVIIIADQVSATSFPATPPRALNGSNPMSPAYLAARAQVRQPASTARSVPGHVDGANAGGVPGAISQRCPSQTMRSQ